MIKGYGQVKGNRPGNTGKTPYWQLWHRFRQCQEYTASVDQMQADGMRQPYIDNILRVAFDFAYNNKKDK